MPIINLLAVMVLVTACAAAIPKPSPQEAACFANETFYHEPTQKCYDILDKGPCPKGEWFVLRKPLKTDPEVIVKAVCVKDNCGAYRIYWPGKGCVDASAQAELCGDDPKTSLANNDFGEGECVCLKSPAHARLDDDPDNKCYELYLQGPCKKREILAVPSDSSVPKCIPDPCFYTSFKLKSANKIPVSATMAMFNDTCYQLETQGPCPAGQTFKIVYDSLQPGCEQLTTAIFGNLDKYQQPGRPVNYVHNDEEYRKKKIAAIMRRRRKRMTN